MSTCFSSGDRQPFVLNGRYLRLQNSSKGYPKYLYLETESGTQEIKLPKYVGYALRQELEPGDWVRIWGRYDDGRIKAVMVLPLLPKAELPVTDALYPTESMATELMARQMVNGERDCSSRKIQVCRKGSCYKRGSEQIWETLQRAIQKDSHPIILEATGCQKACKQGPNLRVWPDRVQYSQVKPSQVPEILQQYFPQNPIPQNPILREPQHSCP